MEIFTNSYVNIRANSTDSEDSSIIVGADLEGLVLLVTAAVVVVVTVVSSAQPGPKRMLFEWWREPAPSDVVGPHVKQQV